MINKKNIVKYPFYYRTRNDIKSVVEHFLFIVNSHSPTSYPRSLMRSDMIKISAPQYANPNIRKKIPLLKPGKKKYIGVANVNRKYLEFNGIDIEHELKSLGVELIDKNAPNKPKYSDDDLTRESFRLKSCGHFKKLTSIMNKQYGHGNWHLRGARKIYAKLAEADRHRAMAPGAAGLFGSFGRPKDITKEIIEKGLKIDVVVVGKVDNLKQTLFKIQLMA